MAAAIETRIEPDYIDVDRQVQRALAPGVQRFSFFSGSAGEPEFSGWPKR